MDLTDSIAPTSDQLDAVDLLGGPRTFTIASISAGNGEQPVNIHLAEFPRVWRPGKSMRRVLVAAWGPETSVYVGRRVRLYCDPDVIFGKDRVGGTRISHLSHIGKALSVPLLVSRGKSAIFTVQPLAEAAGPTAEQVAECSDPAVLRGMWKAASAEVRVLIQARVEALEARPAEDDGPLFPEGGAA